MQKAIHDPETYRQLSIPFQSVDEADKNLEMFYALVKEARKQLRIPDVAMVTVSNAMVDGKEQNCISFAHFGNTSHSEKMFAWGLAQARHDREQAIDDILKGEPLPDVDAGNE